MRWWAPAVVACTVVAAACGADRSPTIGSEELQDQPPIAIVWARSQRARNTGSGDLYVVRADGAEPRIVRKWPELSDSEGRAYGISNAHWSPDRRQIGLTLSVWNGDPDSQAAVVSSDGRRLRTLSKAHWTVGNVGWSPDGSALVYSYLNSLWKFAPQTRTRERIWQSTLRERIPYAGVAWSPDGRQLVIATPEGR